MVALVDPDDADAAVGVLEEFGIRAWTAGTVADANGDDGGRVNLVNQHPSW